MQRRTFLTAAAAAAAVLPTHALARAGSSVSPVGRVGTSAGRCTAGYYWDADGCVRDYNYLSAYIPHWPAGTREGFDWDAWELANGKPLPPTTLVPSSPYDPILQAQVTPGQYLDVTELLALWAGGAVASGIQTTGTGQMAFRNWAGVGVATAAWIGWNTGTFIYLNGAQVDQAIRNVGMGPWMSGLSSSQGDALRAQYGGGGGIMIIRLR